MPKQRKEHSKGKAGAGPRGREVWTRCRRWANTAMGKDRAVKAQGAWRGCGVDVEQTQCGQRSSSESAGIGR